MSPQYSSLQIMLALSYASCQNVGLLHQLINWEIGLNSLYLTKGAWIALGIHFVFTCSF